MGISSAEFAQYASDCDPADALVIVNESGCIQFASPQVTSLFGYSPEDLQDQLIELLVPERFRLPHIGHRLRFGDDRRTRPMGSGQPLYVCCKDGSECPAEIGLRPVRRGLETLTIAIIRPLSRR